MSQQDVIDILQNNKEKWFNAKELRKLMDVGPGSVSRCLRILRWTNSIDFKPHNKQYNQYLYKHKV